jgi:hypothetical protein
MIVFEIMVLKYGGLTWSECLSKAIPKRKTVKIFDDSDINNLEKTD